MVVPGAYDHVEQVLEALELPYTRIGGCNLASVSLRPEQLLIVNCPGEIPRKGLRALRGFVERGGSLFTTDWALRHVIEPAFPGVLKYNERPTRDEVVRVEVLDGDNEFLKGVPDPSDAPMWWLEGSSYPIRIVDPRRVRVLLQSRELLDRYGEAPVAVVFQQGAGEVFHMISHYYLQRTELREQRHSLSAATYAMEKGIALDPTTQKEMVGLRLGDVESAASSARLMANIAARKKLRELQKRGRS